ncbi:glycerophosphodiester phosphodiesterase [Pseudobdellovibrio exovorus]|uniref:glycerophosphodiester phosphodiesterase n=1 Tax=Pseudobdellovibrio exovorus JSS TaxID=1184267 RepID=M4VDU4_9BACT|nr:glycerophosphodiester phosphodiesterase [Pseudobdellovibrio exovorus]AGH96660.1 hypothetical protein A11Q_2444 [Pseudobdellovibrio exovorus JSS]
MRHLILFALLFSTFSAAAFQAPLIIAHRGASGYRPEHTLESYKLAIEMGADFIEPDLVMTKDKVLVARHENEISETTNVAEKFPSRKKTKTIDGQEITGWFTEDFTLKELKTLRAKERLEFRDQSFNGKFEVPTFDEILVFLKAESKKHKRVIGVYPETKHPSYFASIGLPMENAVVDALKKHDLNHEKSAVYLQAFELDILKKLKDLTPVSLVFLYGSPKESPYDFILAKDKRTFADLTKPAALKELAKTVHGIGPHKSYIIPTNSFGERLKPTTLVADAHAAGLVVHPYTFRKEEIFLPATYKGDAIAEYIEFFQQGVDGVFSDFTDQAIQAKKDFLKIKSSVKSNTKSHKNLNKESK